MSCNYADGLSPYENKGILGAAEKFDSLDTVREKCALLAKLIKEANHIVVHTGAGISTSAGIPDFRGPKGVWTLEERGLKPDVNVSFTDAKPTKTHMALKKLIDEGLVQYIISQNIDGLHLKSGITREFLAELHGNMFIEQCHICKRLFVRSSPAPTVGQRIFGGQCPGGKFGGRPCRGKMQDIILDWEHSLPDEDSEMSEMHSSMADLSICLGTTLQIVPSGNIPLNTLKHGGKLVICNLQPTKHDNKADLIINTYVDNIFEEVMKLLGFEIPEYIKEQDTTVLCSTDLFEWTLPKSLITKVKAEYKNKCTGITKKRRLVKRDCNGKYFKINKTTIKEIQETEKIKEPKKVKAPKLLKAKTTKKLKREKYEDVIVIDDGNNSSDDDVICIEDEDKGTSKDNLNLINKNGKETNIEIDKVNLSLNKMLNTKNYSNMTVVPMDTDCNQEKGVNSEEKIDKDIKLKQNISENVDNVSMDVSFSSVEMKKDKTCEAIIKSEETCIKSITDPNILAVNSGFQEKLIKNENTCSDTSIEIIPVKEESDIIKNNDILKVENSQMKSNLELNNDTSVSDKIVISCNDFLESKTLEKDNLDIKNDISPMGGISHKHNSANQENTTFNHDESNVIKNDSNLENLKSEACISEKEKLTVNESRDILDTKETNNCEISDCKINNAEPIIENVAENSKLEKISVSESKVTDTSNVDNLVSDNIIESKQSIEDKSEIDTKNYDKVPSATNGIPFSEESIPEPTNSVVDLKSSNCDLLKKNDLETQQNNGSTV